MTLVKAATLSALLSTLIVSQAFGCTCFDPKQKENVSAQLTAAGLTSCGDIELEDISASRSVYQQREEQLAERQRHGRAGKEQADTAATKQSRKNKIKSDAAAVEQKRKEKAGR